MLILFYLSRLLLTLFLHYQQSYGKQYQFTRSRHQTNWTAIYDSSCQWELDYITLDILPYEHINIIKVNQTDAANLTFYQELSANQSLPHIVQNCIYIFSSNNKNHRDVYSVVSYLQPRVILHMSDETDLSFLYNGLANHCDIYIRQYCYGYHKRHLNTIYMPLGYMRGMFLGARSVKEVTVSDAFAEKRPYVWSFVGNGDKRDRVEMLNQFKTLSPYATKQATAVEMKELYSKANFVPIGQGWVTLDCFRIYEASANGAIPVIVGKEKDLQINFGCFNSLPWIFASSWKEAVKKVEEINRNDSLVAAIRHSTVAWWQRRVLHVRKCIMLALNITPSHRCCDGCPELKFSKFPKY